MNSKELKPIPPRPPAPPPLNKHRINKVSRTTVANLAMSGLSKQEISKIMGVSVGVLNKYYGHELDSHRALVRGAVAGVMTQVALNPKHPNWFQAAKHVMGVVGGPEWKPNSTVDVNVNMNNGPRTIDPLSLSPEDRELLLELTERALEETDGDGLRHDHADEDVIDADFEVVEEDAEPYDITATLGQHGD